MSQLKPGQGKRNNNKPSKKAIKNETEGNVLIFYALQSAASVVLKSELSPLRITYKSPVKAQVQYSYSSEHGIADDKKVKQQIENEVNNMLKSGIKVSCSKRNHSDGKLPDGMRSNLQLYDIKGNDILGVSHIPITIDNLSLLSDFKILKCNHKSTKNILEIQYSFKSNAKDNAQSKTQNIGQFDDQKMDETDARITFSKEIIGLVLHDLNIEKMDKDKLDKLIAKTHDVLNRFQNVSYAKGLKAAMFCNSN